MSKEVNSKISISRELFKKQIFDAIAMFIAMIIIFYFVNFRGYESYNLLFVLSSVFILVLIAFEYSKNMVRHPLNSIVISSFEKTTQQISNFQDKNNTQKENTLAL